MNRSSGFSENEWKRVLERNDMDNVSQKRLRDSLVAGIPEHLRGEIWTFLTKSRQLSLQFARNVYSKLREIQQPSVQVQILKDIHRTFPEHELFRDKDGYGQTTLKNILTAYANYDPEVGYCQGMGFIVGCLLIYINEEELTFWTFVQIMYEINWRMMFKNELPKHKMIMKMLNLNLEEMFNDVKTHIESFDLNLEACFSHFIVTCFLFDTPFDISKRIFDLFLLEGDKILRHLIVKMISLNREKLLRMEGANLYGYLRREMVSECFQQYNLLTLLAPVEVDDMID